MRISLSDDQVDSVIIWELKRHSKVLRSNIESLRRRKNLENFEKEDLKRFREVLEAASMVIQYYSLSDY
jgi:hypothetical protein